MTTIASAKQQIETLLTLVNVSARQALEEYEKTGQPVPSLNSTETHPLDNATDTLALKKAVRLLEGACEQLTSTLAPPAHTIINRTQSYEWACLRVILQARVSDALEGHPDGLHLDKISEIVNIPSQKLARLLRVLATKNCFREVTANVFANNRLSILLRSSSQVADLAQLHVVECGKAAGVLYENLTDSTTAGSIEPGDAPFMYAVKEENIEGTFFDWMKQHPDRRQTFGRAMIGMGDVMGSLSVLQNFPWASVSTVCDIGSGVGAFSIPLTKAFPNITVTLHDLPETIEQAKLIWVAEHPEAIAKQRVHFLPRNFLEEIPEKNQDIYYLRNIVHNWSDSAAAVILKNTAKAMGPNSRLLIHDYVLTPLSREFNASVQDVLGLDVAPEPLLPNFGAGSVRAYNQDITMLLTYNSKERTIENSIQLGDLAGIRFDRVWDFGETSILEFKLATSGTS